MMYEDPDGDELATQTCTDPAFHELAIGSARCHLTPTAARELAAELTEWAGEEPELNLSLGARIKIEGKEYIIAFYDREKHIAVDVDTGGRWSFPRTVDEFRAHLAEYNVEQA